MGGGVFRGGGSIEESYRPGVRFRRDPALVWRSEVGSSTRLGIRGRPMRGTSAGGSKGVRRGVQSWSARLREVREDWARCRRSVAKRRRRVAGRVARVAACGVGRALRSSAEGVSAATEKARGRSSRRQILTRLGGPMSGSPVRGSECVRSGARRAARSRAGPRGRVVRLAAQEGLRGGIGAA